MLILMGVTRVLLQKLQAVFLVFMTAFHQLWIITCQLIGNARFFAVNFPPIVVFLLCILFFSVILSSLAYRVHINSDIRSPDDSKDWNMFIQQFSRLELCILQHNVTIDRSGVVEIRKPRWPPTTMIQRPGHWRQKVTPTMPSNQYSVTVVPPVEIVKHTLPLLLEVQPTREFLAVTHSLTILTGSIFGKYIGFKGISMMHRLNVTMVVPYDWDPSLCSSDFTACQTVYINACVEFQGPKNLFPRIRRPLPKCPRTKPKGIEYRAGLNWQMPDVDSFVYCRHRSMIRVQYRPTPLLSVQLSKEERSVIMFRLLRVTYFLVMFVIAVCVWAFVFGHTRRRNTSSSSDSTMYNA